MVDWHNIQTVMLDMDGTLLDLRFDSYFWFHHLPMRYAEKNNMEFTRAKADLSARYRSMRGTLDWYCADYWSEELDLDVAAAKHEIRERITRRPQVEEFLHGVRAFGRPCYLVTNAHRRFVELKLDESGLRSYFNRVVVSHDYGIPKETVRFWEVLRTEIAHDPASTLMVDDNLEVLDCAAQAGVGHLVTIRQPDSGQPARTEVRYPAITDFSEIMPPIAEK